MQIAQALNLLLLQLGEVVKFDDALDAAKRVAEQVSGYALLLGPISFFGV